MRRGFTLIELLIVIAIVAVLAVTVVLTLNPAELLKQARDSTRVADVTAIRKAAAIYQTEFSSTAVATSGVLYISIPDSSPTCANLGLPAASNGYSYACSTSANYRNINGTGWIPINFTTLSAGSPFSKLPTDSINSTTSQKYYVFVASATGYIVSTGIESAKFLAAADADGGVDPVRFETGSNLALGSAINGLVGYWPFDESAGNTAYDASGSGNNGTLINNPTWTTAASCKSGSCISLNGSQYVVTPPSSVSASTNLTFAAWVNATGVGPYNGIITNKPVATNGQNLSLGTTNRIAALTGDGTSFTYTSSIATPVAATWYHVVVTSGGGTNRLYVDGSLAATQTRNLGFSGPQPTIVIGCFYFPGYCQHPFNGLIDEVRVYNRTLSADEVQSLHLAEL